MAQHLLKSLLFGLLVSHSFLEGVPMHHFSPLRYRKSGLGFLGEAFQLQKAIFGVPTWPPLRPSNFSTIRLGRPQDPQGRQRPPRCLQGAILRPPGRHFGAILGSFLDHFGDMLGHFPTQVTCKPWARRVAKTNKK